MTADRIRLVLNPQLRLMLEALVASGLYGKTIHEAAEKVVCERLPDLLRTGFLRPAAGAQCGD
jgi:hypothetical protein